jgi:serine/threonine protein kinase
VGTNIYAPPEHSPLSAGDERYVTARLTPAADIYSLAKSIYTIVTGESPRSFANNPITSLPARYRDEDWADELLRVINRATDGNSANRHQAIDEFWNDLAVFRQIVEDGEVGTVLRTNELTPQAHVSRGYTPIVPEQPDFEAVPDPLFNAAPRSERMQPALPAERPINVGLMGAITPTEGNIEIKDDDSVFILSAAIEPPKKKSKFLRRFMVFAIFLTIFAGILFGTHAYMRNAGILPEFKNPFKTQTAVATTDIFLRSQASADSQSIGYVTKNSKVKIVNSQNNWYQVDILEQGRKWPGQTANRGWLNGKYLDIDGN